MITECAVTRGNSEDPVGKEQGGREQKTGKRTEGEKDKTQEGQQNDVKCFDRERERERQVNSISFF